MTTYPTPFRIMESYLLRTPGLSEQDTHDIRKYLVTKAPLESLSLKQRAALATLWEQGVQYAVALQVMEIRVRISELDIPCEEVWLPLHWSMGVTHIYDLKVEVWKRPTIRVCSKVMYGRFLEAPFDFDRVGTPDKYNPREDS